MNKKILRTLTALCAALMLTGGFSVTAFAQTPEGQDATDDSGVVYEEPEKEEPLTPDGNATLVDDFGGNKQLITVTTKNGKFLGHKLVHMEHCEQTDIAFLRSNLLLLCLLTTGGQVGGNTKIAFVVFVTISLAEQMRPVIGPPMIIT